MVCEHYECDALRDLKETFEKDLLENIKNKYCNQEGIDCPYAAHLEQIRDIKEGRAKMFSER